MMYLSGFVLWLYEVTVAAQIQISQGRGYILPALFLISLANGTWSHAIAWLIILGLTTIFVVFPWQMLLMLLVMGGITYFVFQRFIDRENSLVVMVATSSVVGLYLLLTHLWLLGMPTMQFLGTLGLTLPVVFVYYGFELRRYTRR